MHSPGTTALLRLSSVFTAISSVTCQELTQPSKLILFKALLPPEPQKATAVPYDWLKCPLIVTIVAHAHCYYATVHNGRDDEYTAAILNPWVTTPLGGQTALPPLYTVTKIPNLLMYKSYLLLPGC